MEGFSHVSGNTGQLIRDQRTHGWKCFHGFSVDSFTPLTSTPGAAILPAPCWAFGGQQHPRETAGSRGRSGSRAFDFTLLLLFFRDGPLRGVAQRTDVVGLQVSEGPPAAVLRGYGGGGQKEGGLVRRLLQQSREVVVTRAK